MTASPSDDRAHEQGKNIYRYQAFGLGIHSNFPLPELVSAESRPDIVIELGDPTEVPPEAVGAQRYFRASEGSIIVAWENVGTFRFTGGKEMVIHPAPGVDERVVRLFVLGASMAILLQQRDLSVFHASAISINGSGVAFAGRKGHGKSTIAATLYARGHDFLSDDTLVLSNEKTQPRILPGYPQVKLWPDAAESVFRVGVEAFPRLRSEAEKRSVSTVEHFSTNPVPLKLLLMLVAGGEVIEIEDLEPQDALLELLPHWYGAFTSAELLRILGQRKHLTDCVNVVNSTPVCLLKRPRSLESLVEVARKVEEYIETCA